MFKWLILLMIIMPAIEIILLIWAGSQVGFLPILGLIVLTALIGATMARHQGIDTLRRAQKSLQNGQMPADEIFNGIFILLGAVFILLPGFITDLFGLILLMPFTRPTLKNWLKAIFQNMMNHGNMIIYRKF